MLVDALDPTIAASGAPIPVRPDMPGLLSGGYIGAAHGGCKRAERAKTTLHSRKCGESMAPITLRGVKVYKGFLNASQQRAVVDDVRDVLRCAPLFQPETARGQKMSVRMTAAGQFGWISDRRGYRYEPNHPDGLAWPPIPESIQMIWQSVAEVPRAPQCCLINFYGEDARMGMHQDRDELDFGMPVVSVSLGDDALFRVGNLTRGGKTESLWLQSGDVLVMGGEARLRFHGIDRLRFRSSRLLRDGGRINLTLRVVT